VLYAPAPASQLLHVAVVCIVLYALASQLLHVAVVCIVLYALASQLLHVTVILYCVVCSSKSIVVGNCIVLYALASQLLHVAVVCIVLYTLASNQLWWLCFQQVNGYVYILGNHIEVLPLTSLRVIRGRSLYRGKVPSTGEEKDFSLYIAVNVKENSTTIGLKEVQLNSLYGMPNCHLIVQLTSLYGRSNCHFNHKIRSLL